MATLTRTFTGATRRDADAGFASEWPRLSIKYTLVAKAWDQETHTLTIHLLPAGVPAPPIESDAPSGIERPNLAR